MKKRITYSAICLVLIFVLASVVYYKNHKKIYTYDELNALPAMELYELFIDNGLVVNEEYKNMFSSKEEFADFFKAEFPLLHQGYTACSYTIHIELADETKRVYEQLTE